MGIVANEYLVPDWFTPPGQEEDPNPTAFLLQPLNTPQYAEVSLEMNIVGGSVYMNKRGVELALRYGLRDWRNFNDKNGKPVEFSPVNFDRIPMNRWTELATEIVNRSDVSEPEIKNL